MATTYDIFYYLDQFQVFNLVLPFLLVFAVIFGILSYMKIFKDNTAVQVVIALTFGLLAVRVEGFYTAILEIIAPRLGVGIVILLTVLILIGLFVTDQSRGWVFLMLMIGGGIIFLIILWQVSDIFNYFSSGSEEIISIVLLAALLIGALIAIVAGNQRNQKDPATALGRALFGDAK